MTEILALDVATTTGWARGKVGAAPPASGSISFGRNCSEDAVFANALTWISQLLEPRPRPDMLVLEAMLPGGAMKGETTIEVRDRLAGLHAVIRAVAHLRGVYQISTADVGDVRAHFIGVRNLKRHKAKREVLEKCRLLGWPVADADAADAIAVWSYACGLVAPETALQVSPLFLNRRRAAS